MTTEYRENVKIQACGNVVGGEVHPIPGEYASIPGCDGFGASPDGEIINLRKNRVISQRRAGNGAMQVQIGKSTRMVHDLVARAYYGHPLCRGYRPKHRNGDPGDNSKDNLLWSGRPKGRPRGHQKATLPARVEATYLQSIWEQHSLASLMQEGYVKPHRPGLSRRP